MNKLNPLSNCNNLQTCKIFYELNVKTIKKNIVQKNAKKQYNEHFKAVLIFKRSHKTHEFSIKHTLAMILYISLIMLNVYIQHKHTK